MPQNEAAAVGAQAGLDQREPDLVVGDQVLDLLLRAGDRRTGLPAVASAFAQKFGEVKFTSIGGEGGDPSAMIGRGIAQVMTLVKQVGADVLGDRSGKASAPAQP